MHNTDDTKRITSANLEAWDEAAPIHKQHNQEKLIAAFSDPKYGCLDEIEKGHLETLNVVGKDVAQVCCNNGQELLSIKRMGAARCVGFDGARGFIDQANELKEAAKSDVQFVCTNIYDIDKTYKSQFDLVVITIGVLSWMPDLPRFFRVVSDLIRPGGALFIYEQHPILDMIEPGEAGSPLVWELSYFDKNPYVESHGLDYFGGEAYDAKPVTSYTHTISEVIMAGVNTDMIVEHFEELPGHISNTWWNVEHSNIGLPMSFTLIMRKSGD